MSRWFYILSFLLLYCESQAQQLHISSDKSTIKIGEQFHVTATMQFDPGQKIPAIKWPDFRDTFTVKSIEVVASSEQKNLPPENEISGSKAEKKYTVTSFEEGTVTIFPVTVQIADESFTSNSTSVLVESIPVDTTKSIRDIKEIFGEEYTWADWFYFLWQWLITHFYVPVAIIAGIIAFVIYYRRKNRKGIIPVIPALPPYEEALQRLLEISKARLTEEGKIKEYYSSITDAIRNYLERRFEIPAMEQTTDEILHSLRSGMLKKENKQQLIYMLQLADLVKFAKEQPDSIDNETVLKRAFEFVHQTKPAHEKENNEEQQES